MVAPGLRLSLADALAPTSAARIVTSLEAPHIVIHTNAAWAELTGWRFTEVAGKSLGFLQGPATAGPELNVLHEAIHKKCPIETRVVNYMKDGTPFHCVIECAPVTGGTHFYATIMSEPITDGSVAPLERVVAPFVQPPPVNYSKRANAASQHHARRTTEKVRLADVLANDFDPIVLCSKDYPHVITHPNQPWLEMCGYSLEEVEGLTNSILTGPETDPAATEDLLAAVRRCEPSVQTLVNYKKGGVRFINQVRGGEDGREGKTGGRGRAAGETEEGADQERDIARGEQSGCRRRREEGRE